MHMPSLIRIDLPSSRCTPHGSAIPPPPTTHTRFPFSCVLRTSSAVPSAVFGELLGPLAPAELLQRPRLADFARHLTQHLGAFPGHEAAAGSGGTAIGIKAVAAPGASQPSGDAGRITALLEQASAAGEFAPSPPPPFPSYPTPSQAATDKSAIKWCNQ